MNFFSAEEITQTLNGKAYNNILNTERNRKRGGVGNLQQCVNVRWWKGGSSLGGSRRGERWSQKDNSSAFWEELSSAVSTLIIIILWYSDIKMEGQVGGVQDIFSVFILTSYWHDVAENKTELVRSNHNVFYFCEPEVKMVSLWREVAESIKPQNGCVVLTQHRTLR